TPATGVGTWLSAGTTSGPSCTRVVPPTCRSPRRACRTIAAWGDNYGQARRVTADRPGAPRSTRTGEGGQRPRIPRDLLLGLGGQPGEHGVVDPAEALGREGLLEEAADAAGAVPDGGDD